MKGRQAMRRLTTNLCVFTAVLLVTAAIADGVLRVTLHRSPIAEARMILHRTSEGVPLPRVWASQFGRQDPVYHHGMRPLCNDGEMWGTGSYTLATNSLGLRDATPRMVSMQASGPRMLIMGDSFTQGVGIRWDDTFVGIVAEAMRRDGVEVLNGGVIGYSPSIYYAKTKALIDAGLEFDTLLVCIDISDPYNEAWDYNLAGDRVVDETKDPIWGRIEQWPNRPAEQMSWALRGLGECTAAMNKLHLLCQVHGVRLIVSVHPWAYQLHAGARDTTQQKHWRTWCRLHRTQFIDAFDAFFAAVDRRGDVDSMFIPGDFHWNAVGHVVMAEAILQGLPRKGKVVMR